MEIKRVYRHELKFIITKNMSEILKQRLALLMNIDENSTNKDNTYFIRSLYFDDHNNTAYYEKMDGVKTRKKYRIRYYNLDTSYIKLECKHKHENMTSKDSQRITKKIATRLMNNQLDDISISDFEKEDYLHEKSGTVCIAKDGLLKQFISEIKTRNLQPATIVDYKRLAYTYPLSDVRVTFDENIQSGYHNIDLFDKNIQTYPIYDGNTLVLEVKFNEYMPSAIAIILSTVPTFRQAVSKFAICRSIK